MKCIFVDIKEFEMEFFLFPDEVDDKVKRKFEKFGFPEVWLKYPDDVSNVFIDLGNGTFLTEGVKHSSFPITAPFDNAAYSVEYIEDRNSIILKLNGTFFCFNDSEVYDDDGQNQLMLSQTEGSIDVIRLNNAKGKLIKKAKDEWGISSPIEALAVDTEYNGKGYKAYLKLHSKSGIYRNGVIASE
ncbi:MAG: hypothetical protein P8N24_05605 [Hellea sp.]|nr:hypothetical protein [Hellea sp.]